MNKKVVLAIALLSASTIASAAIRTAPAVDLGGVNVHHVSTPGAFNSGTISTSNLNTMDNISIWNIQCNYEITGPSPDTAVSIIGKGAFVRGQYGQIKVNGAQYSGTSLTEKSGTIAWEGAAPYPGYDTGILIKNMDGTNDINVYGCKANLA